MPLVYDVKLDTQRIFIRSVGRISNREIVAVIADIVTDEDYDPQFTALIDLRPSTFELLRENINQLSNIIERIQISHQNRIALVINNEQIFSVARTFCRLARSKGLSAEVFKEIEKAEEWLNT